MKTDRRYFLKALAALPMAAALPALADGLETVRQRGRLRVAVYNDFAPYSMAGGKGIDADVARAIAAKLGLTAEIVGYNAGEDMKDDLRNMVWKGHYLGYGPADLMLHVPVDRRLMAENDNVEIFAPYHRETVRLVRSSKTVPIYDSLDSLAGKKIGVEKISIAAIVLLGEQDGKFRDDIKIYATPIEALEDLKSGKLDAVLATQAEIESVFKGNLDYPLSTVAFQRLPPKGWVVGMAVKKSEPELARSLQTAANELIASGALADIFKKYGVQVVTP